MSSFDEKIPPAAAGAGPLLESMVQDHLDQAATKAGVQTPSAQGAAADLADAPLAEEPLEIIPDDIPSPFTAEERAEMLKRAIDSLLAGEPSAQAPLEPAGQASVGKPIAADTNSPTPAPGEAAKPAPPATDLPPAAVPSNITPAELEVLLEDANQSDEEESVSASTPTPAAVATEIAAQVKPQIAAPLTESNPPDPVSPAPTDIATLAAAPATAVIDQEIESKLDEAQGVMAEELAQLMSETRVVEPPSETAAWAGAGVEVVELPAPEPSSPVPAELAAAVQSIMNGRAQTAEQLAAPATSSPSPAPVATETPEPASAAPTAPPPTPAVATLPTPSPPIANPQPPRPNPIRGLSQFFLELVLMILQVIDMPFGWIKEPDKNILGIAAFCLVLGGLALIAWSHYLARH